MTDDDLYESSIRSQGDFGAFFECDGEAAYFYFCDTKEKLKILTAVQIFSGPADFKQDDLSVRWNETESQVGLFIKNRLWAAYDVETGACHVGSYRTKDQSNIPKEVAESFK
jgi:hypothetical protein